MNKTKKNLTFTRESDKVISLKSESAQKIEDSITSDALADYYEITETSGKEELKTSTICRLPMKT